MRCHKAYPTEGRESEPSKKLYIFIPAEIVSLLLLFFGALSLNMPMRLGGPISVAVTPSFLGSLAMVFGIRLCLMLGDARPGLARWIFVIGFLAMLVAGGWNFYWFPPIQDGAFLIARYGRIETPWPAGILPTGMWVAGLIVLLHGVIFAQAGTVPADGRNRETAIEMGVFALLTIVLIAALSQYLHTLIQVGPGRWLLYALIPVALLFVAGLRLARWQAVAIWLSFFSGAYALLIAALAGLYRLVIA